MTLNIELYKLFFNIFNDYFYDADYCSTPNHAKISDKDYYNCFGLNTKKWLKYIDITKLKIYSFNEVLKINDIPDFITHLFLCDFNQPIYKYTLSNNIRYLHFGNNFCQKIEPYVLPEGITHLFFGEIYNQPLVKGTIPNSVIYLDLGDIFNQKFEKNVLPNNVKYLLLGNLYEYELNSDILPNSLVYLEINKIPICNLPKLKYLKVMNNYYNNELKLNNLELNVNIVELSFTYFFNQYIYYLPNNIKYLMLGDTFNKKIDIGILPNGLEYLDFGYSYNEPIERDVIPHSVRTLLFGRNFNHPLNTNNLPTNLISLVVGYNFKQEFNENNMPSKLIHIICHLENKYLFQNVKNKLILFGYEDNYCCNDICYEIISNDNIKCANNKEAMVVDIYNKSNFLRYFDKLKFDKIIEKNLLKELTEKVFHPHRLLNLCEKYNIDFDKLLDIY